MSAPTKVAPAKAPAAKSEKVRKPSVKIDFASVDVAEGGELDRTKSNRLDGTPIRGWVAKSWAARKPAEGVRAGEKVAIEEGSVVKATVAAEASATLHNMIRDAAAEGNVSIRFGKDVLSADKSKVTVSFKAVTKSVKKPKPAAAK